MVGRNDPCPWGNRKKDKRCFRGKIIFTKINQPSMQQYWLIELQKTRTDFFQLDIQGSIHFEPLLPLPQDLQIPQDYLIKPFQFGFDIDTHLFQEIDVNEQQNHSEHDDFFSDQESIIQNFHDGSYTCNKIFDIREESFRQILPIPYTSFAHEMRGEILVQLEKYNQHDEERQDFIARNNGWRVLGWSIKRAKELEQIEKLVVSNDRLSIEQLHIQPSYEQKESSQGLSVEIMGHFDQFYMMCVAPLQGRTQALYGRSMELLYQYLSTRFGKSFQWSMLNEELLIHFLSVWYLEQNNPTPVAAKVFLNTLKKLFYWLEEEKIADVKNIFKRVYIALIRTLPIAIEARKWLKENGVDPNEKHQQNVVKMNLYQVSASSSGLVVLIDDKWIPIKINGYPPVWQENGFWIRGSIKKYDGFVIFTQIENVYPVITIEGTSKTVNHL